MYKQLLKPFFDFFFSFILVLVLIPIFIPIIIILLFTGENRVFYLQDRVGFKNKFFRIVKFATMKENSPNMGTGSLTLRNDPRVLPFGKYLRKTKINEFPQLFNILNGTMSLIGPRPQMEVDFLKFPAHIQKKFMKLNLVFLELDLLFLGMRKKLFLILKEISIYFIRIKSLLIKVN